MKIQLTIKTTYLPTWGAYEGVRELVQNGRDAEIEHGAKLKIDWYNDTLRIENEGTTLPIKALLLGHTTKLHRSDLIGKFGEGLKLGVLALVRAGHPVKIRNGSEVWLPSIERSETFDEDVLTFDVQSGRKSQNRVRVEVGRVDKEDWRKMRRCFLFLREPKGLIPTVYGDLLTADRYQGQVFVKGIFVQHDADMHFGYNLHDAELDRDRKMVESSSLRFLTQNIFLSAMSKRVANLDKDLVKLLEGNSTEVTGISDFTSIPKEAARIAAETFIKDHGENAVPVRSMAESKDVEHLGARGVVVSRPLAAVLSDTFGDMKTIQQRLEKEVLHTHGWGDLQEGERRVLEGVIALVDEVSLDAVDVVDFRSGTLLGQFKEERVLLSRRVLSDLESALATVVHEVAHREGADGDHGHVAAMERLWKVAVRKLLSR